MVNHFLLLDTIESEFDQFIGWVQALQWIWNGLPKSIIHMNFYEFEIHMNDISILIM